MAKLRTSFRIVFLFVSAILCGLGYMYYSRTDPCIAMESKYWKSGDSDSHCEFRRKLIGPSKAAGVWILSGVVVGVFQYGERQLKKRADSFGFRFLIEVTQAIPTILAPVLSTELSGYITLKGGPNMKYAEAGCFYTILSVVSLLFALGDPNHYGLFDVVESVFLGILFAAGKKKIATLTLIVCICSTYRLVFFLAKEMKLCCGNRDEQLISVANTCIHQSRTHLRALEDDLPEGIKDPQGPIMTQLENVRAELTNLENAVTLRRRR